MINNSKAPSELPPEKLPQVTAFQDEFTRQFMDSTEEIEEGFYLMRSGINGYTMLFPEDGRIGEKSYNLEGDNYEFIRFAGSSKENVAFRVNIKYLYGGYVVNDDRYLNRIRQVLEYDGDFEEIMFEDKVIYIAMDEHRFETENETFTSFFGFIKSKKSLQGIEFHYSVSCIDEEKLCDIDIEETKGTASLILESVSFNVEGE